LWQAPLVQRSAGLPFTPDSIKVQPGFRYSGRGTPIMKKLSVAYIVDDGYQLSPIYDLIKRSQSAEHYSIDYLIVQTFPEAKDLVRKIRGHAKKNRFPRIVSGAYLKAVLALESRIFVRDAQLKSAFRLHPIDSFNIQQIRVHPNESTSRQAYHYRDEDLKKIKSLNIDILLDGQSRIIDGGILNVCEFGVISLHHGDNSADSGGPPGFWEVFKKERSTGFVIQRLPNESDGGGVFVKGNIATAPTYAQNLARLYKKPTIFMHKLLENLGKTRTLPESLSKSPSVRKPYVMPSSRIVALYLISTFIIMSRKLFNVSRRKYHRWGVAYQFAEDWHSPALRSSNRIANPSYRFLADPFVFRRGEFDVCFVEDYDFRTKIAKISVFRIADNKYMELGTALDEPFHLSYPFIFTVDDDIYMCPETWGIREIRLYKCVEFPLRWSFHKTLIENVAAADTNIFFFEGKWWLLTNIDSSEIGDDVSSELHVFYSDAFDSAAWTPHPKNPVIFDSERARNGGFFRDGEQLLRVFQRQGFDLYGESMGIAQIKELGVETYREEVVSRIEPRFAPKIIGTHTFSYDNGLLAVDSLKIEQAKPSR
jgi:hypothetical protein